MDVNCLERGKTCPFNMQPQASSMAMAGKETNINWEEDRRACLQCLAAFYRDPTRFGFSSSTELIVPYGFNLQTGEFEPNALKCFRDPAKAKEKSQAQRSEWTSGPRPEIGPGVASGVASGYLSQSSVPRNPFAPPSGQSSGLRGSPFGAAQGNPFKAQSTSFGQMNGRTLQSSFAPFGPASISSPFQR
eukprot:s1114_g23.t1